MSDYTYQDIMRMQGEAKKRVLEMHRRSRDAAESFNGKSTAPEKKEEAKEPELPRIPRAISYPAELQNHTRARQGGVRQPAAAGFDIRRTLKSVFGDLSEEDYERMFILSLCLLLTKEGTDDSLIFALMYLLT